MCILKKNNKELTFGTIKDLTDLSFEKIVKNDYVACQY